MNFYKMMKNLYRMMKMRDSHAAVSQLYHAME